MKKEYINPEMKVIKMRTMTVLAASNREVVNQNATNTGGVYDEASGLFDSDDNEEW